MLSKRSVSESQLLGAVPKSAGTKEGWCTLMEELAWSFKVMYQGACPKKDKRGEHGCSEREKVQARLAVGYHRRFGMVRI